MEAWQAGKRKMADNTGVFIQVIAGDDWWTEELEGQPEVRG